MRCALVVLPLVLGAAACPPSGDELESGGAPLRRVAQSRRQGESADQTRAEVLRAVEREVEQERIRCDVFGGAFFQEPILSDCVAEYDLEGWTKRRWACEASQAFSCAGRRPSGLVVWPQPDSTGLMGWNGYCGETAVANVLTNLCDADMTPTEVHERGWGDLTPGSTPATVAGFLNDAGCGRWEVASGCPSSDQELDEWVTTSYFMPILVEGDAATDYHWTTLYAILATPESCSAAQLDGLSRWSSCGDVLEGWRLEGQRWDQELVRSLGDLGPCTRVRLVEPPSAMQMRPGVLDGSYRR